MSTKFLCPGIMEFYQKINQLHTDKIPFFFCIDFLQQNFILKTIEELKYDDNILIDFPNLPLKKSNISSIKKYSSLKNEFDYSVFKSKYDKIQEQLKLGNSYLTNLTFEIPLQQNLNLEEIFQNANSRYRILVKNKFICFSPETFIKISGNKIYTYPMKGTIDAQITNAEQIILSDEKETSEHYTIVDLLRNDMSMVAKNVNVKKFRYIDEITSNNKKLLQVSSQIEGDLRPEFENKIGDILQKMLPAGSISGAPKKKTLEIINSVENYSRGFYSGIAGVFDGENIDTCVLIRFIEQKGDSFFYKTGGGIHIKSNPNDEYQEILNKIYVPIS